MESKNTSVEIKDTAASINKELRSSALNMQKMLFKTAQTHDDQRFEIELKLFKKKMESNIEIDRLSNMVASHLKIQKEVAEIIIGTSQLGIDAFVNMPVVGTRDEIFKQNSISSLQQDCLVAAKTVNQALFDYLGKIVVPMPATMSKKE